MTTLTENELTELNEVHYYLDVVAMSYLVDHCNYTIKQALAEYSEVEVIELEDHEVRGRDDVYWFEDKPYLCNLY